MKTTERDGKVVGIAQVDETSEVMLISHYGKIIRMDSTTIRESGRNAQGVRLLQHGARRPRSRSGSHRSRSRTQRRQRRHADSVGESVTHAAKGCSAAIMVPEHLADDRCVFGSTAQATTAVLRWRGCKLLPRPRWFGGARITPPLSSPASRRQRNYIWATTSRDLQNSPIHQRQHVLRIPLPRRRLAAETLPQFAANLPG